MAASDFYHHFAPIQTVTFNSKVFMDLKFLLDLEAGPLSQVFGILPLMF